MTLYTGDEIAQGDAKSAARSLNQRREW